VFSSLRGEIEGVDMHGASFKTEITERKSALERTRFVPKETKRPAKPGDVRKEAR